MRRAALAFLIIGNLFATQAFAEPQPLRRADCEAASGWIWNETANVCDVDAKAMATAVKPQPLTKAGCDAAGMSWNDNVLACEEKSKGSAQAVQPTIPASTILIDVDKSTPTRDGVHRRRREISMAGFYGQARLFHAVGELHGLVDA